MSNNGSAPGGWLEGQPPGDYRGQAEEHLRRARDVIGQQQLWDGYNDQLRQHGERAAAEWAARQAAQVDDWQRRMAVGRRAHYADPAPTPGAASQEEPRLIVPDSYRKDTPRPPATERPVSESSGSAPVVRRPSAPVPLSQPKRGRGWLAFIAGLVVLTLLTFGAYRLHQAGVKDKEARMTRSLNNVTCIMTTASGAVIDDKDWHPLSPCEKAIKKGKAKEVRVQLILRDLQFSDFEGSGWNLEMTCPCTPAPQLEMGGYETAQDSILPYVFYLVLGQPGKYYLQLRLTDKNHAIRSEKKLMITVTK